MFSVILNLTYLAFAAIGASLVAKAAFVKLAKLGGGAPRDRSPVAIALGPASATLFEHVLASSAGPYSPAIVYDEHAPEAGVIAGLPLVCSLETLGAQMRRRGIGELWLLGYPMRQPSIECYVREFRHDFVNIRLIPDLREFALAKPAFVDVHGLPAINLVASPLTPGAEWPKRLFDCLFAALVLLSISPLLAVIAIAVRFSSPGPILFRQMRKGVGGREFAIYKFRTMRQHVEETGRLTQARRGDSRITRVGAFLRKTSLDELPQFVNVLKGQMSVVGPRPHAVEHDELYKDLVDDYMYRYRIKPGITGWAQINGLRGETDRVEKMAARVMFDLYYIQNWSFWLDLKIIGITMLKGFFGKTAY
ncbi:undecaprenyl-phosphate glucose phosphotransferase [Paraburkholderia sp. 22099]|jgi:putative colanic acid biosynthesis UDP-glucose lipid carrier transferase|uniref:Putative colanic acid biosysnthesis UDP-glucose lipid carrier transferase n=1 Tax=Paraburkholderia terricola TaxID=169427 RepID=A0A1M6NMB2_9BURK|nr:MULTISPECIES: undecaprenyl-phosphate glucose phosphotransferase [Paraburkholderia]MDR6443993.1 putative colanic acid biosynthesis UDP-glucose lipid carrier transferase [Paraburkholderia terricola]MDR6494863.1 putative colanic acid biosynthesis UDP-glucose lipid carrier transferase [Paraburkholderia terricola]SDO16199.1 putative colanic acid biosysnthesis UDP-glucose lipid carrier transferase [Paraburkholderia sediminicola]SHJ96838.1 putative colanic acid biosysnthesis UDP-glucose lipid carri